MATENSRKNTLYFGFRCSYLKNELDDPYVLLLDNKIRYHVAYGKNVLTMVRFAAQGGKHLLAFVFSLRCCSVPFKPQEA